MFFPLSLEGRGRGEGEVTFSIQTKTVLNSPLILPQGWTRAHNNNLNYGCDGIFASSAVSSSLMLRLFCPKSPLPTRDWEMISSLVMPSSPWTM